MTRRRLTILLHWGLFIMLLAMIKGGTSAPALRWAFVGTGGLWAALALGGGLLGKPGPKLTGAARAAFPWMHWGMYALIVIAILANAGALLNILSDTLAWNTLLLLLVASIFHGIFHLWRHTSLNDGALRKMTPRFLHSIL